MQKFDGLACHSLEDEQNALEVDVPSADVPSVLGFVAALIPVLWKGEP